MCLEQALARECTAIPKSSGLGHLCRHEEFGQKRWCYLTGCRGVLSGGSLFLDGRTFSLLFLDGLFLVEEPFSLRFGKNL